LLVREARPHSIDPKLSTDDVLLKEENPSFVSTESCRRIPRSRSTGLDGLSANLRNNRRLVRRSFRVRSRSSCLSVLEYFLFGEFVSAISALRSSTLDSVGKKPEREELLLARRLSLGRRSLEIGVLMGEDIMLSYCTVSGLSGGVVGRSQNNEKSWRCFLVLVSSTCCCHVSTCQQKVRTCSS
jgi:hypothetical protein